MINQITIKNFKSFKDVSLKLGPLNLFIGTNASGKSNFFDALRVLQGIGYGFTLHEILDGKPKSATSEVWEGVRGGSAQTAFAFEDADQPTFFQVSGTYGDKANERFTFRIAFSAKEGRLCEEYLSVGNKDIYDSSAMDNREPGPAFKVRYYRPGKGQPPHIVFERSRAVLVQVARGGNGKWTKAHSEVAARVAHRLADMQRIDPAPALLRGYSQAHEIGRMGERGENFAALIRKICSDAEAKQAYLNWLRALRPHDVDDVDTLKGAIGEPLLVLRERNRDWPAPALSDGTLRFAAIAAAFFQPDMPGVLTIEEIENGIHASRLRLLVELLRNRAAAGKTQVMATTHSPIVLAWLRPEEYSATFYAKRDEQTGQSCICPLMEIPRFSEIVSKQPISDLFAEGWMEAAL
ncbi:MAG TPA: AAA family ATPase [Sedimentisphaerales bacterium]|nr:AAA family ATPase [Sedimentisphaerales bacterium]